MELISPFFFTALLTSSLAWAIVLFLALGLHKADGSRRLKVTNYLIKKKTQQILNEQQPKQRISNAITASIDFIYGEDTEKILLRSLIISLSISILLVTLSYRSYSAQSEIYNQQLKTIEIKLREGKFKSLIEFMNNNPKAQYYRAQKVGSDSIVLIPLLPEKINQIRNYKIELQRQISQAPNRNMLIWAKRSFEKPSIEDTPWLRALILIVIITFVCGLLDTIAVRTWQNLAKTPSLKKLLYSSIKIMLLFITSVILYGEAYSGGAIIFNLIALISFGTLILLVSAIASALPIQILMLLNEQSDHPIIPIICFTLFLGIIWFFLSINDNLREPALWFDLMKTQFQIAISTPGPMQVAGSVTVLMTVILSTVVACLYYLLRLSQYFIKGTGAIIISATMATGASYFGGLIVLISVTTTCLLGISKLLFNLI